MKPENDTQPIPRSQQQRLVLWFADSSKWEVRQVDCPRGRYPESDSEGNTIYENTHFDSKIDALSSLQREASAWIELTGRAISRIEDELLSRREEAGRACQAATKVSELISQNA